MVVEQLEPLVVSVSDLCKLLRISRRQFFTLRANGQIPLNQIRLGHKIMFNYESARAWVNANCPVEWSWEPEGVT